MLMIGESKGLTALETIAFEVLAASNGRQFSLIAD
jgi:hypothetical protein